jgi:hypothetical protein
MWLLHQSRVRLKLQEGSIYATDRLQSAGTHTPQCTNEPQKNGPPEAHAHTHDFTLFDERMAPGLNAVIPRRSHSPGASAVARRVSKAPSRPPFPLAIYTVPSRSLFACTQSISYSLLPSARRR